MRRSLLTSFSCALQGIWYCFRTQRNMRLHGLLAILAIMLAAKLDLSTIELALLLITIGVVFVVEMINTSIEKTVDLFSLEYHPLAKVAKDVAAGAVLCAAASALMVGICLVMGRLF